MTDVNTLRKGHCVPCEGGTATLTNEEENAYESSVAEWALLRNEVPHKLQREFTLKNFVAVIEFVKKIAELAEEQGHHPDLNIHDFKKLTITFYTHAIGGLSMNDFIMAAKIDEVWNAFVA